MSATSSELWWSRHQPTRYYRRLKRKVLNRTSTEVVTLAWGVTIEIDPRETIGWAIWTEGVYDLAVSELLVRLAQPGDTVLDIGGNIGYMASILAWAVGPTGTVHVFEPHPKLLPRLRGNLDRLNGVANVVLHPVALSDHNGEAQLVIPEGFDKNQGIARIDESAKNGVTIPCRRLDDEITATRITVAKIDIEGHEETMLHGTDRILRERLIDHILFEDFHGRESPVIRILKEAGYTIFQIGTGNKKPTIAPLDAESFSRRNDEPPNYLATLQPEEAIQRAATPGWQVVSGRRGSR